MKLTSLLVSATCLTTTAFGVNNQASISKSLNPALTSSLRTKSPSTTSALFRDPSLTRGGAVPGWASYNNALDEKPLTTKALTSLVGWFLGDLLVQVFMMTEAALDIKRLVTLSAFGMLWHGPTGHYFYNWLDGKIPGTDAKSVVTKVAIDQILWCPVFMTVFFTYLGLVNGDSVATIGDKIKKDLFAAVQGSWKVWPIVHSVNFKFIKPKYRIPYINSFQIGFNMFLSIIGNK